MRKIVVKSRFYLSYSKNLIKNIKNNNMCFIHIPKTGGKSLLFDLEKKLNIIKINKNGDFKHFPNFGSVTFGHIHYLSLLKAGIVSSEYHRSSYKFSVVRNPYNRIASLYNYLSDRSELEGWSFDYFLDQVLTKRPPIGIYNKVGISQTNPQVDWIVDDNGEFLTDDVFKLEDLDELYKKFYKIFGVILNFEKQKNISTKHIAVNDDVFSRRDRVEKINEIYKRDFSALDYNMI